MRWDYGMLTPSHFIILTPISFSLFTVENEFMTALTAHAIVLFSFNTFVDFFILTQSDSQLCSFEQSKEK